MWQPIETAPKDGTAILAYCVHDADKYFLDDGKKLTKYGAHCEAMFHCEDGIHIVEWGGGDVDGDWEIGYSYIPDWWFVVGSEFECAANPTHWMPLPEPPETNND